MQYLPVLWNRPMTISTWICLRIIIGVTILLKGVFMWMDQRAGWPKHIVIGSILKIVPNVLFVNLLTLFCYLYGLKGYSVDNQGITINRHRGEFTILFFIITFFIIFMPMHLPAQDKVLSRNDVISATAVAFLPMFIEEDLASWIPKIETPIAFRYGVPPLAAVSFLCLEDSKKALKYGSLDAAAMSTAYLLRNEWPLSNISWITGHHFSYLTQYEVYKSARNLADTSGYQLKWEPVDMHSALLSPFNFKFLKDSEVLYPFVLPLLGYFILNYIEHGPPSLPKGDFELRGKQYSRNTGLSLFVLESFYRAYWAGIGEEALYRGCLLPELSETFGIKKGIALNTLLFVLIHYEKGMSFKEFIHRAFLITPGTAYICYLSYKNNFDYRKVAFQHVWSDFFFEGINFLFKGPEAVMGKSNCATINPRGIKIQLFSYSF